MIGNSGGRHNDDKIIKNPLDEGWWESILTDEETNKGSQNQVTPSTITHSPIHNMDWKKVKLLFEDDEVTCLQVYGYNRGGLLVQGNGILGFVPVSHLLDIPGGINEQERKSILDDYIGKMINLKVIECDPKQERVVFSERAAIAGEGKRKHIFKELKIGDCVEGVVTNITEFGVFVDLGGVEGLIHVSELSWGRVQHPMEIVSLGQSLRTEILQVCQENSRVALSLKRLTPNPWDMIIDNYKPGDIFDAIITKTTRFGVFARLPIGVEGLIHISSIHTLENVKEINQYLCQGQNIKVEILHIDCDRRRLGLGLVCKG